MALTTTATDVVAFYERVYTPKKIMSLALKDAPLTAYLPKDTSGSGENVTVRLLDKEMGGVGTTLSAAITAEKDPGAKKVILDYKKFYTSTSLTNDAIELSEGNAITNMLKLAVESSMRNHGDQLESSLWGPVSGYIGRIATGGISGNVVTLTNANDCFNFEPDDIIIFDDTITGASPRAGSAVVASVQYDAGTVTFVDLGTVTSEAAGDYLFKSTFENGAGPIGIQSWIPVTAPTAGDAFGTGSLDRSLNPTRLAGWRYSASAGMSVKTAIIRGLSYGKNFGGRADTIFMSTDRMADLVLELGNQVVYDSMGSKEFQVNFRTVKFVGPQGDIQAVVAPKCPNNSMWALERSSWSIKSVGELVRNPIRNNKVIDSELEDGVRLRWKTFYALTCHLPGHNGVITVS